MGDNSAIEWTDATWNPIIGCSRVSEGCRHCYAERTAIRQAYPAGTQWDQTKPPHEKAGRYHGLVKSTPSGPRWTGEVRLVESALDAPLRWKRPRRIFVNSMGDLFHEKVPDEWLDRIFDVMYEAERHTFQVLTKRPERMNAYCSTAKVRGLRLSLKPLPNVWIGVSVEDRETYKMRVLYLANTPAAIRFVSFEPLLTDPGDLMLDGIYGGAYQWAIVGGESGPGARPFDLAWARSTIAQCKAAGVPVFVKQLGARPIYANSAGNPRCALRLVDRKGGSPTEWPADLRVREFPA